MSYSRVDSSLCREGQLLKMFNRIGMRKAPANPKSRIIACPSEQSEESEKMIVKPEL